MEQNQRKIISVERFNPVMSKFVLLDLTFYIIINTNKKLSAALKETAAKEK